MVVLWILQGTYQEWRVLASSLGATITFQPCRNQALPTIQMKPLFNTMLITNQVSL